MTLIDPPSIKLDTGGEAITKPSVLDFCDHRIVVSSLGSTTAGTGLAANWTARPALSRPTADTVIHLTRFSGGMGPWLNPSGTPYARLVGDPLSPDVLQEAQKHGIDHADHEFEKSQLEKIPMSQRTQEQVDRLKKLDDRLKDYENFKNNPLGNKDVIEAAEKAAAARRLQRQAAQLRANGAPEVINTANALDAHARQLMGGRSLPPLRASAREPLHWSSAQTGLGKTWERDIRILISGRFANYNDEAGQVSGGGVNVPIFYVTYADMDQFMENLFWGEWPSDPVERALQQEIQRRIDSPEGWNSIVVYRPGIRGDFTAQFQEEYEEHYGYWLPSIRINTSYSEQSSYMDLVLTRHGDGGMVPCKKSMNPWFSNVQYTPKVGNELDRLNFDLGSGGPDPAKQDWLDYLQNDQGLHDLRKRLPATETWRYYMAPFGTGGGSVFGVLSWYTTIEQHTPVTQLTGWIGHDPNGTRFVAPAPSFDPRQWPSGEARALPYARVEGLIP